MRTDEKAGEDDNVDNDDEADESEEDELMMCCCCCLGECVMMECFGLIVMISVMTLILYRGAAVDEDERGAADEDDAELVVGVLISLVFSGEVFVVLMNLCVCDCCCCCCCCVTVVMKDAVVSMLVSDCSRDVLNDDHMGVDTDDGLDAGMLIVSSVLICCAQYANEGKTNVISFCSLQ